MAAGASGGVRVTAVPIGERPIHQPMKVLSTGEIIVRENFDKWTQGSIEEPNFDEELASVYHNDEIDPKLMQDNMQWRGNHVYSAGGACALMTTNPMDNATLETPYGDYSGSIKVQFLARYYGYEQEDEEGKYTNSGSTISMGLYTDDYDEFQLGENDGNYYNLVNTYRLYREHGWYKFTVEFDNFTAYNDAYLSFFSTDVVLIDDIEVTTSTDKFIAAPIITGVTDVTETSFTVNFEPVYAAYNYYTYLYTLQGYDEETGEPIYLPVPNPETMATIEAMGWTVEQWWELSGFGGTPYENYGKVEKVTKEEPTSFTFTNLDPATQYYYAVRSHFINTFSDFEILPMNQIAPPAVTEATDIFANTFTANWEPVVKADSYVVSLFGVNKVMEDSDDFIIFEEDFENVSHYTDSDDIYNPDMVSSDSGLTIDDLTSSPGWQTRINHTVLVNGMLGLDDYNYWLYTPDLYVGGDDKITLSLRAEFLSEDPTFYVKFAGVQYQVPVDGYVCDGTYEIPTHGLDYSKLQITGPEEDFIFIDYIIISQSLKAGDYTYTYMGSNDTADTAFSFTDLDADRFDLYGYSVQSVKGEGKAAITSEPSTRIIVDLKNGSSFTGVTAIDSVNENLEVTEIERYTIDGRRIDAPMKGLNIVRMSDGSVRKVMVR